jgi:hypothetical protein
VLLRSVSPLIYSLAAAAVGAAALGNSSSHRAPLTRTVARDDCPRSVVQQIRSVKAFRAMMPVFRHPRCFNCHGNFDIAAESHAGSDFVKNSGLNPRELLNAEQRRDLHEFCGTCHSNITGHAVRRQLNDSLVLEGWMVAPKPMLWHDKNDEQLCMQMKQFEPTGNRFIDHLTTDHNEILFIEAAFRGDRALEGKELQKIRIEKPPGTQARLIEQAKKWVNALDADREWPGAPSCGCVPPRVRLQVTHQTSMEYPRGIPSREASQVDFKVDLEAVDDSTKPYFYTGEISLHREVQLTLPQFCTGTAARDERWTFAAIIDPDAEQMTLWPSMIPREPVGRIECRNERGKGSMNVSPGTALSFLTASDPVVFSDSTRELSYEQGGLRERLRIKVLEVRTGQ